MAVTERIYEATQCAARPVLERVPGLGPKLRRGIDGRRHAVGALEAWSARRDERRPLLWLHAPSVGEALMAQAILEAARAQLPDAQFAFTYFSPSAERMAERVGADVAAYLPWDVRRDMSRALAAVRPNAVAFVRTELWPVLTREAQAAGVPLLLLNAVLSAGSSRTGRAARRFLGPAYRRLDAVGAVAAEDAERFALLGVAPDRVHVTGDARFDQVEARVRALDPTRPLLRRLADAERTTVVAGSTWPEDEERLVPAFAAAAAAAPARLIVAPHEPDEPHLERLERTLAAHGLEYARLAQLEGGAGPLPTAIVVDRVGVLADLYAVADAAYVGGGFGSSGLHSVIEPGALGKPVVFGPRAGNAREAAELASAGGGVRVADADALRDALQRLLSDGRARAAAGEAARQWVTSRLGGAERNARLLLQLLPASQV